MRILTTIFLTLFFIQMTYAQNEKPKEIKTIGILLYDGFYALDAIGPHQVFSSLIGVEVSFIAPEKGDIQSSGLTIKADKSMAEIEHLDILLVPGGLKTTYLATQNQEILDWIKKIDKTSIYTTSVCTGAWILGAAGSLEGRKATTNWYKAEEMLQRYGAIFEPKRWIRDGKYWTAAGVTAGMDMALAIVNDLRGKDYTQAVMLNLEYDPQPPIEGGSVEKTDPKVVKMMRGMYASQLNSVKKKK